MDARPGGPEEREGRKPRKTPSTSLKGVAGRSVKARKNPEEKQKKGFPEPKLDGNPQHVNAAARYSPTPSRVQYHRRSQALASGFGKGPGVSPGP